MLAVSLFIKERWEFFFYISWLVIFLSLNCFAESMDLGTIGQNTGLEQNKTEKTYTFKKLGWHKSVTLNGYKPNYTFYLPIGQYSNPQRIVLHLKLAFSPLLNEETQVEIKFNQTLVRRLTIPVNSQQELNLERLKKSIHPRLF